MPLTFSDIQGFLTPYVRGVGAPAVSRGAAGLREAARMREARRYHDMLAEQEKRRAENIERGQQLADLARQKKIALDILKETAKQSQKQKDTQQKAILASRKLALSDPIGAQAILASQGMLKRTAPVQPQQVPAQPQVPQVPEIKLPSAAIKAGIDPGQIRKDIEPLTKAKVLGEAAPLFQGFQQRTRPSPEAYTMMVGEEEFTFDREKEIAQRAENVKQLFKTKLEGVEDEDKKVAARMLALAPQTVEITDGNEEDAVEMLLGQYYKELANKKAEKKHRGKRLKPPAGYKGDESLYLRYLNDGHKNLQKTGFFEGDAAVRTLKQSYNDMMSDNGTRQWNAIRAMIKTYESGKLSDFDVKMAEGFKSLWQEWDRWFNKNLKGTLTPTIQKQIADSILVSLKEMHENIKRIAGAMQRRVDIADRRNRYDEGEAYRALYEMHFNKPEYDWYKPLPGSESSKGNPADVIKAIGKKYGR